MRSVGSAVVVLAAVIGAFVLGAVGGYAARTPVVPSAATRVSTSQCPAGMHVVVYYTAHTWACMDDGRVRRLRSGPWPPASAVTRAKPAA